MNDVVIMYITDASGQYGWRVTCGVGFHSGELVNIRRTLSLVRAGRVRGWDDATARMVALVGGVEVNPDTLHPAGLTADDAALLAELGV